MRYLNVGSTKYQLRSIVDCEKPWLKVGTDRYLELVPDKSFATSYHKLYTIINGTKHWVKEDYSLRLNYTEYDLAKRFFTSDPYNGYKYSKVDRTSSDSITFLGSFDNISIKWSGSVLAQNGYIYFIPDRHRSIVKFNPSNDTYGVIGNITGTDTQSAFYKGTLAYNGCIYCPPQYGNQVLKINPNNDTYNLVGSVPTQAVTSYRWSCLVRATNEYLYGIPLNGSTILKINPTNDTCSSFGSLVGTGKWRGGVLAPNGLIYGIGLPGFDTSSTFKDRILVINPSNDTYSSFVFFDTGTNVNASGSSSGGTLTPNGLIYSLWYKSNYNSSALNVMKVNPNNHTVSTFSTGVLSSDSRASGLLLAGNGYLYSIPYKNYIMKINPNNDTISTFYVGEISSDGWSGGSLAHNGSIYCPPSYAASALKITPQNPSARGNHALLSPWYNNK